MGDRRLKGALSNSSSPIRDEDDSLRALALLSAKEDTSSKEKQPLNYRPEIDGLRSLAVIPVLIFHAWPDKFPGGNIFYIHIPLYVFLLHN